MTGGKLKWTRAISMLGVRNLWGVAEGTTSLNSLVLRPETRRAFGPFHAYLYGMNAFLVIVVIVVCAFLGYRRAHAPAAGQAAGPAPTRPPTSERAVSALDPKVPIDRAKAVIDKVQAQRKESGEYNDRR